MPTDDQKDPVKAARNSAAKDIANDADLNKKPDRADDLDEGELARLDNSDEKAFDALEQKKAPVDDV